MVYQIDYIKHAHFDVNCTIVSKELSDYQIISQVFFFLLNNVFSYSLL